jgi:hypothetical protein
MEQLAYPHSIPLMVYAPATCVYQEDTNSYKWVVRPPFTLTSAHYEAALPHMSKFLAQFSVFEGELPEEAEVEVITFESDDPAAASAELVVEPTDIAEVVVTTDDVAEVVVTTSDEMPESSPQLLPLPEPSQYKPITLPLPTPKPNSVQQLLPLPEPSQYEPITLPLPTPKPNSVQQLLPLPEPKQYKPITLPLPTPKPNSVQQLLPLPEPSQYKPITLPLPTPKPNSVPLMKSVHKPESTHLPIHQFKPNPQSAYSPKHKISHDPKPPASKRIAPFYESRSNQTLHAQTSVSAHTKPNSMPSRSPQATNLMEDKIAGQQAPKVISQSERMRRRLHQQRRRANRRKREEPGLEQVNYHQKPQSPHVPYPTPQPANPEYYVDYSNTRPEFPESNANHPQYWEPLCTGDIYECQCMRCVTWRSSQPW